MRQVETARTKWRAVPVSIKSGGAAAARAGQYKKRGRCRSENWSFQKAEALPQREMGSIKHGGAAASKTGEYRKLGRCRKEIRAVKK